MELVAVDLDVQDSVDPRIHSADRVKVWLACGEHVEFLREFLAARDFPVRVVPAADGEADGPERAHA